MKRSEKKEGEEEGNIRIWGKRKGKRREENDKQVMNLKRGDACALVYVYVRVYIVPSCQSGR